MTPGPIGIFDSGYGGLTILSQIRAQMPQYDFLYLGDNARTPYGTRSFEVVYEFTSQAVKKLFEMGCPMVILACNTASAKALRTIQQIDLPKIDPSKRVLGIITSFFCPFHAEEFFHGDFSITNLTEACNSFQCTDFPRTPLNGAYMGHWSLGSSVEDFHLFSLQHGI